MNKRSNALWLTELREGHSARERALTDLHTIVLQGLSHALAEWLSPSHPNYQTLVEDVAQETLLRVTQHLDDFEQRSQFTTWVHKIAVRVALTELRRQRWKDKSLDEMVDGWDGEASSMSLADDRMGPAHVVEQADTMMYLMNLMQKELTAKQRAAMVAVAIKGMPLEEVARQLGTERNALYKLLHDARVKLKRRLMEDGWSVTELLAKHGSR